MERLFVPCLALVSLPALVSLGACEADTRDFGSDADSDGDSDSDSDSDSDNDSDADGGGDTDTDTETESDTVVDTDTWDCDALPSAPVTSETVTGAAGYHDLAFDDDGHMVGFDGFDLVRTTVSGPPEVLVSGMSWVQGMDYLPDGDLVAATDTYGLARITPTGTVTSIAPGLSSLYDLIVGPDGMVYCADNSNLYRVDPSDGTYDVIASGIGARGVEFSPDLTRMYITSGSGYGYIYVAYLDDELNLIDSPSLFTTISGGGTWLDGIAVDACDNLWIPNYNTTNLYRISTEGAVYTFYDWPDVTLYGHGIKWGSGVGGWDDMSVFLPQPYNGYTVVRFGVGVHYRE
jgi:hypothetical protein